MSKIEKKRPLVVRTTKGTPLTPHQLQALLEAAGPQLEPLLERAPELRRDVESSVPTLRQKRRVRQFRK